MTDTLKQQLREIIIRSKKKLSTISFESFKYGMLRERINRAIDIGVRDLEDEEAIKIIDRLKRFL